MKKKQKPTLIFMGTSDIAGTVLESLCDNNYPILAVVTQPDYPSLNKKESIISPVKKLAQEKELKIIQPLKLNDEFEAELKSLHPDLIVVIAFGKILPERILELPKFKSINVHASLLPALRGPAPIQNALIEGLHETGVTIMLMDKGIDTGDILSQKEISIDPADDYISLTGKLGIAAASLLIKTIPQWVEGKIKPLQQDSAQATLCQLIEKSDGKIIWDDNAADIYNKFRAFRSWPGVFTFWENKNNLVKISLNDITPISNKLGEKHSFGEVFKYDETQIGIQTGDGVIIIKKLQLAGKNETDIDDFLNGYPQFVGSILK